MRSCGIAGNRRFANRRWWIAAVAVCSLIVGSGHLWGGTDSMGRKPWAMYKGGDGPGRGKRIVLISGDEEYRSEQALPQLGKILAKHHGFDCAVLFAVDPATETINPNVLDNIPGLAALDEADLMIIFTRFRALPDDQMRHIDAYLKRGGPVIGIRTATHAFKFPADNRWVHYSNGYNGPQKAWRDGFGRLVLGEKWISHHGRHKHESTRGIIAPGAASHPITRGLRNGDIWGPSDVYGVRLPLPGDSKPIVLGQVVKRKGPFVENDPFYGMRPDDGPPVAAKNDPMMPIAWTRTYQVPGGKSGRAFASTIGAATDLANAGVRRLLVNAVYWALGMADVLPAGGAKVDLVGPYKPDGFGFRPNDYWRAKALRPSEQ